MGMMNWRKGGDEADEEPADEDEFDVDDEGSAVADALDDEWDDGLDDEWGDEFGDEDDALVHELQDKVNGMETELGGVSSSMKTIKEENKRIAETVDELDDTIRKLLDVYEIVTRGINPFVDDAQAMANMNNEGSFGMFGEVEEQNEDALDPSLAGANAESFFDEDFDDVASAPEEDDVAPGAAVEPADPLGADADADDATHADDATDDGAESGGGVSFEDLKAEYEAAGGEDLEPAPDGSDDDGDELDDEAFADAHLDGESTDETVEFDDLDGFDDFDADDFDADDFAQDEFEGDEYGGDAFDDRDFDDRDFDDQDHVPGGEALDGFEVDNGEELPDQAELLDGPDDAGSESGAPGTDDAPVGTAVTTNGSATYGDERAASPPVQPSENALNSDENGAHDHDSHEADGDYYLGRVPDEYVAELLMMEWAEELVSVGGTAGAMDACRYYERLGWISPSVSDRLSTHVVGTPGAPDPERTGEFVVDDHVRSLGFVRRLGGDAPSRLVEPAVPGGEHGGIRG